MHTLVIDSSERRASVALTHSVSGKLVCSAQTAGGANATQRLGASEELLPLVDSLVANASELDTVLVTLGPGSFTGIRIGLAAAEGIAHALNLRLFGVMTLGARVDLSAREEENIVLTLPANKNEQFAVLYSRCAESCLYKRQSDVVTASSHESIGELFLLDGGQYVTLGVPLAEDNGACCAEIVSLSRRWLGEEEFLESKRGQPLSPIYAKGVNAPTLAERGIVLGNGASR